MSASPVAAALLTLRFATELALVAGAVAVGVGWIDGWAGWVVGIVLAGAVGVVWGMLLSPRRRLQAPLATRIVVELVLFAAVCAGLVAVGHPGWGIGLLTVEVLVVAALLVRGIPPGTDVARR